MYTCEYCKSTFKTKSNLKHHQWTAKYCLKLQNIINDEFSCEFCSKILSTKYSLDVHYKTCKNKPLQQENSTISFLIKQLEKAHLENKELNKNMERFKLEVNKTNHSQDSTFTKCVLTLDIPDVEKIIEENLDIDTVFEGQQGLVKFTLDHILTNKDGNLVYRCTDSARKIFRYTDPNGKEIKDVGANKLINTIHKLLVNKARSLMQEKYEMTKNDREMRILLFLKGEKITIFEENPSKFINYLVSLTSR